MRLSIQQTSLGARPFDDVWRLARQAGLEGLNLCYPGKADVVDLCGLGYAVQIDDTARRHGLAVSGLHLGYLAQEPLLVGEPGQREEGNRIVREALTVAKRVSAPVVVVPFAGASDIRTSQRVEAATASLRGLSDDARDARVDLALEIAVPYEPLRELLTGVDRPQVKVCYDTGDAAAVRQDSIRTIRSLGPDRIAQVHFKDANLSVQPPDFSVRLGHGDVRFDAVLFALRSVLYDGWIVLETPPGDEDGQIVALHVEDARSILSRGMEMDPAEGGAVEHAVC